MDRTTLDRVCFGVCVVCIAVAVALALTMIWVPSLTDGLWRGLATVGVVFLGASSVLSLSRTFGGRDAPRPPSDGFMR
ncbi:MAG: hypothetical protein K2W96_23535 [Gemmataceae bacterium]|nr:hypothetical protein [Gemmataceae bacterium]